MKGSNKKELTYIYCRSVLGFTCSKYKQVLIFTAQNPFWCQLFLVCDRLYCAIEPYKEKSHSSYNEWLYYIYSLFCSSELVSMYLVQSKRLYFLRSEWIYAMSFTDTTMILKNFSKSNKNARNFYSAFELIFQKGSLHKYRKNKVEKIYSPTI